MSSINGNNNNTGPYSNNNDGPAPNAAEIAQQNVNQQARKRSDKAITEAQKAQEPNIIEMVGMTPEDATAAASGAPKTNKYTAAGAVSSMPPPSAPKAVVTPKTQALYSSMHADVNQAIGSVQSSAEPVDWKKLTPTMTPQTAGAASDQAVDDAVAGATSVVNQVQGQFAKVSSGAMTMAFLMLRTQGQSDGLNINNQMGDMQSAIREADLNQQIKSDKEAQVKLDKAAKKQAAMKKAGPIIEAIIAILTAVITIATCGSAVGIALTLAAMLIGFVAGGAAGGAKKGDGFDIASAVTGLSVGSMIVPVGTLLNGIIKAVTKAVEVGIATTIKQTATKALSQASKLVGKGGAGAGEAAVDAGAAGARQADQNVEKQILSTTEKKLAEGMQKSADRANSASEKAASTAGSGGAEAGDQSANFLNRAAENIKGQFAKLLPQELKTVFSTVQENVNAADKYIKANPLIGSQKLAKVLENVMLFGPVATGIGQAVGNYKVAQANLSAQKDLLAGKTWGLGAKVAQDSWKNTQDFLSTMQDQHNSGITQVQQILAAHNQAASKAISYISS